MKSIFFAFFLIISSVAIAQDKTCTLWLGEVSESTNNIKQLVEKHLEIQPKLQPATANNIQEMRDDNELAQIKIWLKPKKMLVKNSAVYNGNQAMNTVFGNSKMFIERNSGGFGKKGLPMSTLTVTAK